MATIQIRDLPEEAYEVIRRRARAEGRSIQSYMREQVIEMASTPTAREALAALEERLAAVSTPGATRESVLAALDADRR
jgi:plasmid stability protein